MMGFQTWQSKGAGAPVLIFIPGFLSETNQATGLNAWRKGLLQFARRRHLTCSDLVWESESLFTALAPLLNIHSNPEEMLKVWDSAKTKSEEVAHRLASVVEQMQEPVHIVGHSLGAVIGARTAQLLQNKTLQSLTLLAPAIKASEFNEQQVVRRVETPPHIFHSRRDMTLMCLFGLSQFPDTIASKNPLSYFNQILATRIHDPALGVVGLDSPLSISIDVTPLLHFQYANVIHDILRQAPHLKAGS
tara:strand:- start:3197 stop:3937 length:741 start_codon:yes stop_codon:yes gene_type:complete